MKKILSLLAFAFFLVAQPILANAEKPEVELEITRVDFYPERDEVVLQIDMKNNTSKETKVTVLDVHYLRVYDKSGHLLYEDSFRYEGIKDCYMFPKQTIHVPFFRKHVRAPSHKGSTRQEWDYSIEWNKY